MVFGPDLVENPDLLQTKLNEVCTDSDETWCVGLDMN